MRQKRASEVVYFIQAKTSRLIKIGVTYSALRRRQQLQTGATEPLELVAVIRTEPPEWPEQLEASLHHRFAYARVRGEWFEPVDALVDFICQSGFTLEEDEQIRLALLAEKLSERIPEPPMKGRTMKDRLRAYKEARGLA